MRRKIRKRRLFSWQILLSDSPSPNPQPLKQNDDHFHPLTLKVFMVPITRRMVKNSARMELLGGVQMCVWQTTHNELRGCERLELRLSYTYVCQTRVWVSAHMRRKCCRLGTHSTCALLVTLGVLYVASLVERMVWQYG